MKKAVQKRVSARKQAVGRMRARGVDAATARKRNYVRTRAAELEAQGKTVDRAALRKKFESGQVSRAGFYKPGEKAALRKRSAGTKSSGGKTTTAKSGVGDAKDRIGRKPRVNVGDAKDRIGRKPRVNVGDAKDKIERNRRPGQSTVLQKNTMGPYKGVRRDIGGLSRSFGRSNAIIRRKVKSGAMTKEKGDRIVKNNTVRLRTGTQRGY